MGPPPFSDGNLLYQNWDLVVLTFLQWGHRLSAMETRRTSGGTMTEPTFNGATAFQRWKRGDALDHGDALPGPSMGPPPFSDGNTGWIAHPTPPTRSFNGATAFQRWKLSQLRFDRISSRDLQWGHRLSAMETSTSAPTAGFRLGAFNGATAFQRWKPGSFPRAGKWM